MANIIVPSRRRSYDGSLIGLTDRRIKFAYLAENSTTYHQNRPKEVNVLSSGSFPVMGIYGKALYNSSVTAVQGGVLSLKSGLSDLTIVAVVAHLSSAYGSQMKILWTGGDQYNGGIRIDSYYQTVSATLIEGYSGTLLSINSLNKNVPAIVAFRRLGTNLDLTVKYNYGTIFTTTGTDTVRNVCAAWDSSVYIAGNNAVSLVFIIEGSVDDNSLMNYIHNPYSIFSGINNKLHFDPPQTIPDQITPWADSGGYNTIGGA
jgi:hypothetical protein